MAVVQAKQTTLFEWWRSTRVPVIRQLNAVECGIACLAMILNYYGQKISLAECRRVCHLGQDGVTASTIAQAARRYGLEVKAFSVIDLAELNNIPLPAIVHWNFNHFVVIEKWSQQYITIVDPAIGRRQLSFDAFDVSFTGVLLTFSPTVYSQSNTSPKRLPAWQKYLQSIRGLPGLPHTIFQVIGLSLLLQISGLIIPLLTRFLVDQVLPQQMMDIMFLIGIGVLSTIILQILVSYLRAALLIYLRSQLDSQIMLHFFKHLLTLPFQFFQQRSSGDLIMRLNSNIVIRETFTEQTIAALLDSLLVVSYILLILLQDFYLGVLVLGLGIVQLLILFVSTPRIHELTQQNLQAQAKSYSYLVECFNGIATLKASGVEKKVHDYWSNLFWKHLNISIKRSRLEAVMNTGLSSLQTFAPLILLSVGIMRVLSQDLSLGTMLSLNTLGILVLTPFASLVESGRQFQFVGAHLERIMDVMDAKPEQTKEGLETNFFRVLTRHQSAT